MVVTWLVFFEYCRCSKAKINSFAHQVIDLYIYGLDRQLHYINVGYKTAVYIKNVILHSMTLPKCQCTAEQYQRRRAVEALEARAPPPDSVATLVNSLQNRVKSITLCVNF